MKSVSCRCVGLFLRSLYYPTTSYTFFTTPLCLGLLSFYTHGLGWTEKLICSLVHNPWCSLHYQWHWLFYVPLVTVLVPSWILSELSICGSLDMEWSVGCFPCGLLLLFSLLSPDPQTELEDRESEYRLEVLLMMLTIPQRSVLSSRKKITWKAY